MRNIAVILAGGTGSRLGGDVPKQFVKVAGRAVIAHTIDAFEKNLNINEIAVVIHPQYIGEMETLVQTNTWRKVKKILTGGRERSHSSIAAINAYDGLPDCNLIFHDAVRPLVSQRIINDVANALKRYSVVNTAVPVTDSIIEVDESGEFEITACPRRRLRQVQTPQGFRRSVIAEAYKTALQDPNFAATDDCGVALQYLPREKVYVVQGEAVNIKLTYREDVLWFEQMYNRTLSVECGK